MTATFPDVVVLLPGISGSELVNDDKVVWGWSGGALARDLITAGDALRKALWVSEDSPTAKYLDDGIRASRLLPDLHLLPGVWKVDGYSRIQSFLTKTFNLQLGNNFFPFAYDWRRDNRAAARRLQDESARFLSGWRTRSGNTGAKLILIAHSMGGLISRYFLEVLGGWRDTRALITFGTPYAGSMNAIDSLANGVREYGMDLTDVMRRMYSTHQLLPTYACCDCGGESLKHVSDTTIPGLDETRTLDAAAFHGEIATAVVTNRNNQEYRDSAYKVFPVVGYNQPTRHTLKIEGGSLQLLNTRDGADPGGDGTVPRQSAVPDGFDLPSAMFCSTRHASLQDSPMVLTHVAGVISSLYLRDDFRGATRGRIPVQISLAMKDIYWSDEPLGIRARPTQEGTALHAIVSERATGRRITRESMRATPDGWHECSFPVLEAGSFEIVVGGRSGIVESARDVFEVLPRSMPEG
jgi:hypothetical protein